MLNTLDKLKTLSCAIAFSFTCTIANAESFIQLSVEEKRVSKALTEIPNVAGRLATQVTLFEQQITKAKSYTELTQVVIRYAEDIWKQARISFNERNDLDDRPLYWARLQMSSALRRANGFSELLPHQQRNLLWRFELLSRGSADINFDKQADKKILLTGFDPFFLDRHIDQSNPSGVVALSLDDVVLSVGGETAEIEVLMIPVRFADFDQGMIETLLTPYIKNKAVDMVLTVSMGRENFDLERFPALRRSANAPDNLNVYTGATKTNPIKPLLNNKPLIGDEFVEFSLPIEAMQTAMGEFKVNDNRRIATLAGEFDATSLKSIVNQTSVSGSGGGYLSNEISYRSILLRNKYQPLLPVGHIHTPRISAFDPKALQAILSQTKNIITQGVPLL